MLTWISGHVFTVQSLRPAPATGLDARGSELVDTRSDPLPGLPGSPSTAREAGSRAQEPVCEPGLRSRPGF